MDFDTQAAFARVAASLMLDSRSYSSPQDRGGVIESGGRLNSTAEDSFIAAATCWSILELEDFPGAENR
jgi:hypothetical protein